MKTFQQYFPQPGWVEHDPNEIWSSQFSVITEAIEKAGITDEQVACIGIANPRETTIVWDRKSGEPIYQAIVWQDRRTADFCEELKAEGGNVKGVCYDLSGRVVENPSNGMYIIDGKKVLIK